MDDLTRHRRALLFIILGFIVLLYLLGAVSLWARQRFLDEPSVHRTLFVERTMKPFADAF
jgi:hypothetical protein